MAYYNPYSFVGGNTTSPHLPPQQSFNFFGTAPSPASSPRHPYYHPSHFGQHPHPHHGAFQFGPGQHPFSRNYSYARHGHHESTDLDEEERATLAHLHSIQQRREAEQASIRREAEIRARAEEERLATLRRVAEAREAREKAIREAIEERQRQKVAIQQAIVDSHRQQREAAAVAHRAQIEAAIQAKRQAYIDAHRARQIEQQKRFEAALAQKAECAKRCAAKYAQHASRQAAEKAKVEYKDEIEALNGILGGLFGIFGINLVNEETKSEGSAAEKADEKVPKAEKDVKVTEVKDGKQEQHVKFASETAESTNKSQPAFPEDVNDLLTQFLGLRLEPTSSDRPATGSSNKTPEGLNEFLSRFGLVFEPLDTDEEVKAPASAPAEAKDVSPASEVTIADPPVETLHPVTQSLPVTPPAAASSSSSSSGSKPAHVDEAPLTSFLNSFTDLPPFVRDILGNVEIAFKEEMGKRDQSQSDVKAEEEVKGKGKGVASGEKRDIPIPAPVPAPAVVNDKPESNEAIVPDSTTSLSTLSSISDELNLVLESFTFPSTLAFGPTPQSVDAATPALLFNKTNSPYHAQAHKLLQLLLAADGVASAGNKDVRRKRKEVVGAVERALEALEGKRDEIWQEVKARRDSGEVEDGEQEGSASSSETSSVVDLAEQHTAEDAQEVEHVKHVEPEVSGGAGEAEVKESDDPLDGYDVPATTANNEVDTPSAIPRADEVSPSSAAETQGAAVSAVPNPEPAALIAHLEAHPTADKAEESKNKVKEDEGYELL